MLTPYRRILTRPGTALFSATGLVARLPISMVGLGIVLLVEDATGSYGLAGAVSGTALVANGVFAIAQGRLLDRLGQSRVLPVVITVWGAALSLLTWSVEAGWPLLTTYLLAGVAGAALPSVGTCVRARWSHTLRDPRDVQTAFALEAVADETVFMLGPILATVLATAVHPVAGLVTAIAAGLLGTYAFSAQRVTEPPPHPRPATKLDRVPIPWATVLPLTVACSALGLLFGSAEVTTVAFAEERGATAAAGGLLALWALGSLLAGLVTGAVAPRRGPLIRLRWGALAMTLATAPLALVSTIPVMAVVLLAGGFAIAPTLIAAMSLAQQTLPASRLTEGMAFLQTGIVAGVAPGAALAGLVIDEYGASAAYLVSTGGGLVALAAALLTRTTVRDHDPSLRPDLTGPPGVA